MHHHYDHTCTRHTHTETQAGDRHLHLHSYTIRIVLPNVVGTPPQINRMRTTLDMLSNYFLKYISKVFLKHHQRTTTASLLPARNDNAKFQTGDESGTFSSCNPTRHIHASICTSCILSVHYTKLQTREQGTAYLDLECPSSGDPPLVRLHQGRE